MREKGREGGRGRGVREVSIQLSNINVSLRN